MSISDLKIWISLYYKNILMLVGPELIITPLALKYATTYYGCFLIFIALLISFLTVWLTYKLNLKAQFDSIYEIAWRFGGNSLRTFTKVVQLIYNLVQVSIYVTLISALLEFLLNHARGEAHGLLMTSNEILKISIHFIVFLLSILSFSPLISKLSVHSRVLSVIAYILLLISSIAHFIHFKLNPNYESIKENLKVPNYTFGDGFSIFPYFICIFATHNNLPLVSPSINASTNVKFSALLAALLTIGVYAILYGNFVYNTLFSETHAIPLLFYPSDFYDTNNILFTIDVFVACLFISTFFLAVPSLFTFIHDLIDEQFFSEWQPSLIRRAVICLIFTSFAGMLSALFWMDDIQIAFNGAVCGVIMIYFIPGIVSFVYGGKIKIISLIVVVLGIIWFAIGIVYVALSLVLGVSDTIANARL
ncbi:hypothetical protein EHI8A_089790 [Entamoeba histolytica HM-1:IMSS-B]|uniref:Amino acid transporter n=8 Tax=Entamoeba TaxID=5758 RepID=C4M7X8_ENTH1|nr:hypothetical protein ENU1_089090 [Entamoeba nuttalli P19]XP_651471.1 hypothetical protein EHI_119500 [Entamoeba histolytica HM-1:IMSS]EMD49534.1 Hypothetical protein EHI5A_127970 [Entamoeba histolytica KU27]EMH76029.1 hypothetical protein EHI8A_089790 [Entamoeba histolytica HM-1:IMSS-B]EMS11885.1 hypothetical protein KM1_159180 [Entamoeba histolytica HM-3:IMSS]ENY64818.1 hypothetical protein EHI7A_087130 [Entamoeba histolytica HM-1:IMSS-A]GAT97661.1 hypothetical protein CL6EHI_119500 [Enta|eukprot:XP_008857181.1 hypothetical protein ENU1_089090 [Entamoeba nuttalli P19]